MLTLSSLLVSNGYVIDLTTMPWLSTIASLHLFGNEQRTLQVEVAHKIHQWPFRGDGSAVFFSGGFLLRKLGIVW